MINKHGSPICFPPIAHRLRSLPIWCTILIFGRLARWVSWFPCARGFLTSAASPPSVSTVLASSPALQVWTSTALVVRFCSSPWCWAVCFDFTWGSARFLPYFKDRDDSIDCIFAWIPLDHLIAVQFSWKVSWWLSIFCVLLLLKLFHFPWPHPSLL